MIIVAGHLTINPTLRGDYLDQSIPVVAVARQAAGCLDFSITADTVDADRINIFERWDSVDSVEAFRGDGPSNEQMSSIDRAQVSQYEVGSSIDLT